MAKTFILLSALLVVMAIAATPGRADANENPSTAIPTAGNPSTAIPTAGNPSTAIPTAGNPSTAIPTAGNPSTAIPTAGNPSTASPTTGNPTTTVRPTTIRPTTAVTTTAGPSTTAVTTTAGPSTTTSLGTLPTKDPIGSSTTSIPFTTEAPSTDPCNSNPCGDGSTCENRFNQSFVCLCLPGDSYNNQTLSCQRAKVFPGQLRLSELTYTEDMSNNKSQTFQETSKKITTAIDKFLKVDKFSYSTVLELRKVNTRSGGNVEASVELIFQANAEVTEDTVIEKMKEHITCGDCPLKGSNFDAKDLCESRPCNETTTKCVSENGDFSCTCADGYIPTIFSNRICLECASGFKAENSKCVPCPFGQTGFNCKDDRLLTVVIAASVLGGLLLIALILLPIIAVKTKKKTPKSKMEDLGKPYVSHSVAKAPPANSNVQNGHATSFHESTNGGLSNAGVPRIPRATTTSNSDSRTNLEMTPSNSRQNLIPSGKNMRMDDDQDDTFTFDQPRTQRDPYGQNQSQRDHYGQNQSQRDPYSQNQSQRDHYGQNQSQRDPYGQNQSQRDPYGQNQSERNPYAQIRAVNPYAKSQGNSNPYYM